MTPALSAAITMLELYTRVSVQTNKELKALLKPVAENSVKLINNMLDPCQATEVTPE